MNDTDLTNKDEQRPSVHGLIVTTIFSFALIVCGILGIVFGEKDGGIRFSLNNLAPIWFRMSLGSLIIATSIIGWVSTYRSFRGCENKFPDCFKKYGGVIALFIVINFIIVIYGFITLA